jgi:hypothetical protein
MDTTKQARKTGFLSRFKRKTKATPPKAAQTEPQATDGQADEKSNTKVDEVSDEKRTLNRYLESAKMLQDALSLGGEWGSLDFPQLRGEPADFDDAEFKRRVDQVLNAQKSSVLDKNAWAKATQTMQSIFTALSPLAQNFLTIANQAASVSPPVQH